MIERKRGELYRIPGQGRVAGVCAGVADYFGWETWLVRILLVSGILLGMGWFIVIYIAAWFILDKKEGEPKVRGAKSKYQQTVKKQSVKEDITTESIKVKARIWQAGEPPKQALYDIRRKFMALEKQLRSIESYVTSAEFTVSREINRL
ncbi:envelope stress response membrane protein PspC [Thalassomonas actiniarum]|uniref:Envelope stress response membrane protein PspC n=1 Tax=Thalassomonas actiniarum TaxID=485447 RepID=A0AAE9YQC4_9GAMM|nr:envelope stress response membrane protein PspC [Thalassomonas actiniarum]WDD97622.1 envelope stress response membrane protein PspC [Thalassomonas actiniarum]